MTLSIKFFDDPVTDLASSRFQSRLRDELSPSPLTVLTAVFGMMVSVLLIVVAVLVIVGFLNKIESDRILGTSIAAVGGLAALFVGGTLVRRWRIYRSYKNLLMTPQNWKIQTTEIIGLSFFALPALGSSRRTCNLRWAGVASGSASVEVLPILEGNKLQLGQRATIAVSKDQWRPVLLVSLVTS